VDFDCIKGSYAEWLEWSDQTGGNIDHQNDTLYELAFRQPLEELEDFLYQSLWL
jgi:hypothetical protein